MNTGHLRHFSFKEGTICNIPFLFSLKKVGAICADFVKMVCGNPVNAGFLRHIVFLKKDPSWLEESDRLRSLGKYDVRSAHRPLGRWAFPGSLLGPSPFSPKEDGIWDTKPITSVFYSRATTQTTL